MEITLSIQPGDIHSWLIAQRLCDSLPSSPLGVDGQEIQVTASLGTSTALPDDEDVSQLLLRVDNALYDAKHTGKSTVRTR